MASAELAKECFGLIDPKGTPFVALYCCASAGANVVCWASAKALIELSNVESNMSSACETLLVAIFGSWRRTLGRIKGVTTRRSLAIQRDEEAAFILFNGLNPVS
jgi:hypothetical protein